ncbi:MAG: ATP synthase F0 subunit B [Armatimonadetes bacterium]|nr:ATP synthase F0 subunit B [Armatimonadota bacterium]
MLNSLLQSLNIDPLVIVLNVGLFLILLAVMNVIFWRPITRHLDARKQQIKGAHAQVDQTRRDMEVLRSEYEQRIAQIEAEARGTIQQTVKTAQAQREEVLAAARREADELLNDGKAQAQSDHARVSVEMRTKLDDMALHVLLKATGSAPSADQERLVDEYIARTAFTGGQPQQAG